MGALLRYSGAQALGRDSSTEGTASRYVQGWLRRPQRRQCSGQGWGSGRQWLSRRSREGSSCAGGSRRCRWSQTHIQVQAGCRLGRPLIHCDCGEQLLAQVHLEGAGGPWLCDQTQEGRVGGQGQAGLHTRAGTVGPSSPDAPQPGPEFPQGMVFSSRRGR